jgi:AP-1-like factor
MKHNILTLFRDKIQTIPQVQDGSLDIDSLCQELKQKARCSETGIVIEQKDIDDAILRTKKTPTMS